MSVHKVSTITHRSDFVAAAASGHKFIKPSVIVQLLKRNDSLHADADAVRAGFTATKKLGNAVIRNRVKRRLRAAAMQLLPVMGIAGHDYVFIGRTLASHGTFDNLIRDMKHALKRLADPAPTATST